MSPGNPFVDRMAQLADYLQRIDEHIALGRERIAKQFEIVARKERAGLDISKSKILLEIMRDSLRNLEAAARRIRSLTRTQELDAALRERSKIAIGASHGVLQASGGAAGVKIGYSPPGRPS
jgi:hypothetical protein